MSEREEWQTIDKYWIEMLNNKHAMNEMGIKVYILTS